MENLFKLLIGTMVFLMCVSCNKDNDGRLTEKANIEGQANAEGQRKAEAIKALEMESDLEMRQRFYQALSGTFNGIIKTKLSNGEILDLNVRFTFIPNLPPYKVDRSRTMDEIISDLNNLYLTVDVLHFDPKDSAIAFPCTFEKVHPDLAKGTISLAKDGCPSLFTLHIFAPDPSDLNLELKFVSERVSREILNGQRDRVEELKGFRQSSKTPNIFDVSVKR